MSLKRVFVASAFTFIASHAEQVKIVITVPEENIAILKSDPVTVQYRTTSNNYTKTVSNKGVVIRCITPRTNINVYRREQ